MAATAADRNLLFGLLALQNGLIDQGQLVAGFQAWTRASTSCWPTNWSITAVSTRTIARWSRLWSSDTSKSTAETPSGAWP